MGSCLGLQFQELILTKVEWFLNPIREQLITPQICVTIVPVSVSCHTGHFQFTGFTNVCVRLLMIIFPQQFTQQQKVYWVEPI